MASIADGIGGNDRFLADSCSESLNSNPLKVRQEIVVAHFDYCVCVPERFKNSNSKCTVLCALCKVFYIAVFLIC